MGVKDVDLNVHWGVSQSIMFYLQEIGCAGRDGCQSQAILYVNAKILVVRVNSPRGSGDGRNS